MGYFDMASYESYLSGALKNDTISNDEISKSIAGTNELQPG